MLPILDESANVLGIWVIAKLQAQYHSQDLLEYPIFLPPMLMYLIVLSEMFFRPYHTRQEQERHQPQGQLSEQGKVS